MDFNKLEHHPLSEMIVEAIADKIGTNQLDFIRIHTSFFLTTMASMMRTTIQLPNTDPEPVCFYGMNLAPSGFGKGFSTKLLKNSVTGAFMDQYLRETSREIASSSLSALALKRALAAGADIAEEEAIYKGHVEREFMECGAYMPTFDSATIAAVKQARTKIQMGSTGSLNLQMDEIGSNLLGQQEVLTLFLELFGGHVENKLIKNTKESLRTEVLKGITPTNMMLFGVDTSLFDDGKVEEALLNMLDIGYARRCFFGYILEGALHNVPKLTPQELLDKAKKGNATTTLETISDNLEALCHVDNANKIIHVPDDTALLYYAYANECAERAKKLKPHKTLEIAEMRQRQWKVLKFAGTYAFIDNTDELTVDQLSAAIKVGEESGNSFKLMINREKPYIRLAKHLATIGTTVTQADLMEQLPYFKGPKNARDDMLVNARAWGYGQSILIMKEYADSVERYTAKTLQPTNLNELIVSTSYNTVHDYIPRHLKWEDLAVMSQDDSLQWCNHHLIDEYRQDNNAIPGFNLIILDVDNGTTLQLARSMLRKYKAMYYTTKRHKNKHHRFRIILPTNYKLELEPELYKEFMNNLNETLPFEVDTVTGQMSRKWSSCEGQYGETEGELFDVLPYIPQTSKNEERIQRFKDMDSLGNLERWVMMNTEEGNRNNQLLKFALILVDGGLSYKKIIQHVGELNDKFSDSLEYNELSSTVFTTVRKKIKKRDK